MATQALPITSKNFRSAQQFLDVFQYDVTTLQLWKDRDIGKIKPGKILWNGDKGSSVTCFSGDLLDHSDLVNDIKLHQNQGLSVWFMVNEGNGEVATDKETARSQLSVTHLTACFVDTDNGDIRKLDKFCKAHDCPYHLLVNTSPNKYHAYFLLEKIEATPDNIAKWKAIQTTFLKLDKRFDRTMIDYSRVLRVPFFYHNKQEPFLIKAKQPQKDLAAYSLDDLFELTNAHEHFQRPEESRGFEYPEETIDSGARHQNLLAYLRSLTAKGLTDKQVLIDCGVGFARRNFTDFKPFMPGGGRYSDLEHNVDSVIAYQKQEEQQKLVEVLEEADRVKAKGFYHDPSFFFSCPNKAIADMVRCSTDQARYPCHAYDFAAILAMIGTMKSHLFVSSTGLPPVNYFLCFGPTGTGKAHSQKVIDHAMGSLGESACFFRAVKTEKGIYRALAENNSRALVMMDEIEDLLAQITNGKMKVEAYTKNIKQVLLQMYTFYNQLYKSALTGNEKDKPYVIPNPHLNLIGYATPEALAKGFNVGSLKDGFLPRFSILSTPDVRVRNKNAVANPKLDRDHIRWIREVAMQGKGCKEEALEEIEELEHELDEMKGTKSAENKARKLEIEEKLRELKSGGRVVGKATVIPFTDKALTMFNRFADKMDDLYSRDEENPLRTIYTRVAEKAARMAVVIAEDKITTQVLDWCIEFAENQLKAEMEMYGEGGRALGSHHNYEEEQYERLMRAVARCEEKGRSPTKRELNRSAKMGSTVFERILKLALDRGTLEKKEGRIKGQKVVLYTTVTQL